MLKKIKDDIYNNKIGLFFVLFYCVFMEICFKSNCIIKVLFKTNCPGCGLTHATIYMLKGDFEQAIKSNYTVFFWWITIFIFLFDRYVKKLNRKFLLGSLIITGIITFTRYLMLIIA